MTVYFSILFALYFVLLGVLRIGWSRAFIARQRYLVHREHFISIVVPVRNEEKNIGALLQGLKNQTYASGNFEVIIVDDHSIDGTTQFIKEGGGSLHNLKIIFLTEREIGKKAALTRGINHAKGDIIATTDADCQLPPDWLSAINTAFQDSKINMSAGMVAVADKTGLFFKWQAMEFASVMGTGIAGFGLRQPIMCNGANLAFRKETFLQVQGFEGNDHIASGDDEFLMRKIQSRSPGTISSMNSTVVTQPQISLRDFLSQRIRWAGKWKVNTSITARLLAVFILIVQVFWVFVVWNLFTTGNTEYLAIFILKVGSDLLFLLPIFRRMKIKFNPIVFLFLQFLYPFYVIFVGLLAPWTSYQWKGRHYND